IHANDYDANVSATNKQTHDVRERFHPTCKLFTIPVGVLPDEQLARPHVAMTDRQPAKVLVTARVAPEKQIDHIVAAIGIAKKDVPNISLDVYGYVDHRDDDRAMKRINAAIEKYHLQGAIKLHDYTNDVGAVQRNAQVYALASVMEGFNLSL
ncbi:glycosyltransferase, partial [Salmonella enterica subsp. enterica serovar Istanbul]|nr:glycosyltransferase [Salmonella enterica subsp. enterica serovar Istanbul]